MKGSQTGMDLLLFFELLLTSVVFTFTLFQCGGGKKKADPTSKSSATAAPASAAPSAAAAPAAPEAAPAPAPAPAGGAAPARDKCSFPKQLDGNSFKDILQQIDTFIFDADGVLWLGDNVIEGSPDFIRYLHDQNKQLIILTNNTTKRRDQYSDKLSTLGYPKYFNHKILVNPSVVVADRIQWEMGNEHGKKVYIIGENGLRHELDQLSIPHFGSGKEDDTPLQGDAPYLFDYQLPVPEEEVGAVVVAYEKHFNYIKLLKAANYLKNPDCFFYATNEDETTPGPNPNLIIPDAGPMVAAIRNATAREPTTMGKPCTPAFDYIRRHYGIHPSRTMMIGDRTNTDVLFGRNHGLKTMLVLSGVHQESDISSNMSSGKWNMVPNYFSSCLGSLIPDDYLIQEEEEKEDENNNDKPDSKKEVL